MRSTTAASAALVALVTLSGASAAHATCIVTEPAFLWSYPSADEVVPPTASFWVLPLYASVTAEVVGVGPVAGTDSKELHPPALEPGETYELLVTLSSPHEWPEPVTQTIPFATSAAAPLPEPPGRPVITSHSESEVRPEWSEECRAIFFSADCYDTGQDTYVTLNVDQTPHLWLVRRGTSDGLEAEASLWPGECGPPVDFTHHVLASGDVPQPPNCYELVAVDEHGQRSPPATYCTTAQPEDGSVDAELPWGCTSTAGGMPLWAVLLVGLVRRRRRRHSGPTRRPTCVRC